MNTQQETDSRQANQAQLIALLDQAEEEIYDRLQQDRTRLVQDAHEGGAAHDLGATVERIAYAEGALFTHERFRSFLGRCASTQAATDALRNDLALGGHRAGSDVERAYIQGRSDAHTSVAGMATHQ